MDTRRHCNVIRHLCDNKTSYRELDNAGCPLVNAMLIQNHQQNLRGKLQKDFAFETELYSKISVWKNLKFSQHFFQTFEVVARRRSVRDVVLRYFAGPTTLLKKRLWHRWFPVNFAKFLRTSFLQNISSGCSSSHITINSSLSSILFDFGNILISRNIKNIPKSSTLESECEISDSNSKKLDESWTRPTFLQLILRSHRIFSNMLKLFLSTFRCDHVCLFKNLYCF